MPTSKVIASAAQEHSPFEFRSPHGVRKMECQSRYWNGVSVRHVVQYLDPGRVWHDLSSKDPTVAILLDQVGGCCDARLNVNRPPPRTRFDAGHTVFVPAEMTVWGYSDGIESTRDLRLSFDPKVLTSILGDDLDVGNTREPVLMVYDDKIARCASLLAEECREPESRMYGESLTTALTALLFTRWKHPCSERAKGLAPWQLRRVLEFFEAHFSEDISLRQLAELVGLSQSQFARAFKASTGAPPYRWFVAARIKRAQELLLRGEVSLANVSSQTGFADQSHFTKAFRRVTGTSPDRWRRIRRF
jgi:AraC family transcriptional regulator